ncbi:MAG: alpha/beta fold hydrolase [Gelidibacter sp.]
MKYLAWFFVLSISFSVFAQHEETILLKDSKIYIKTFGKGKPLLIINGGPGMNSEGFASLAEELGKNNLAILYDQRGTGKSTINEISAKTMTMDLMVDDIEAIRTHLKIDRWIVFGHSFGGMLASYYATKFPDTIDGLILSSSGGLDLTLLSTLNITSRLTEKQQDSLNYWTRKINNGDTSNYAALQRGKFLAPAYLYDKTFVPLIAERLTQGNMSINGLIWENMRAIDFDCKPKLKNFKKPVLIIQGNQDVLDRKVADIANSVFPNSDLFFIDKSAHYGWLEQPEAYFGKIKSFLSSLN